MPRGKPCEFTQLEQDVIAAAVELEWSERTIARYLNKPKTVIHRYLVKLRVHLVQPEELEIMLPVNVLTPIRRCPQGHVQDGDGVYCVECDETGIEDHPRLRRSRRTDPKPDPKPPDPKPKAKQTRKERRKQIVA